MRSPVLSVVLLALALPSGAQTLFKCVGRDGKVTYQSDKCADDTRQSTVRPPDPVAPRAAPEPVGDAPADLPVDMERFVGAISDYENCAATVPGFSAKHEPNYKRWKERHRAAFARFNQDGPAQRRVRESVEYVRQRLSTRSAEERAYDAENCERKVAAAFAPETPKAAAPNPTATKTN